MSYHDQIPGPAERAALNAALLNDHIESGWWDEQGRPAPWPDDIDEWRPFTADPVTPEPGQPSWCKTSGRLPEKLNHGTETSVALARRTTRGLRQDSSLTEEAAYDGVPSADLVFEEVDWSDAVEHACATAAAVSERPDEFDVGPDRATEHCLTRGVSPG